MRVLLTNDDGIDSLGITALYEALEGLGEILPVARQQDRAHPEPLAVTHLKHQWLWLPRGLLGWSRDLGAELARPLVCRFATIASSAGRAGSARGVSPTVGRTRWKKQEGAPVWQVGPAGSTR